MNRRDFLLLRPVTRRREFELSCERLFLQCLDTQATAPGEDLDGSVGESPCDDEPPASFIGRSREQLFEALGEELREVEVLKVVNSHWLVGDLRQDFDRLIAGFCARGGRVEIQT
jgi:hypothetical protein